jgi:hypothetical protein
VSRCTRRKRWCGAGHSQYEVCNTSPLPSAKVATHVWHWPQPVCSVFHFSSSIRQSRHTERQARANGALVLASHWLGPVPHDSTLRQRVSKPLLCFTQPHLVLFQLFVQVDAFLADLLATLEPVVAAFLLESIRQARCPTIDTQSADNKSDEKPSDHHHFRFHKTVSDLPTSTSSEYRACSANPADAALRFCDQPCRPAGTRMHGTAGGVNMPIRQ